MGDLTLTKLSGRLKVNIGAVLRTRMNTGDCRLVKASGYVRRETEREAVGGGSGDGRTLMLNPLILFLFT